MASLHGITESFVHVDRGLGACLAIVWDVFVCANWSKAKRKEWREYEIYFRTKKGWTANELAGYWKELEADKWVPRDFFGRALGQELRLDVPIKLPATVDRASFHVKEVENSSKQVKNRADTDIEAYL